MIAPAVVVTVPALPTVILPEASVDPVPRDTVDVVPDPGPRTIAGVAEFPMSLPMDRSPVDVINPAPASREAAVAAPVTTRVPPIVVLLVTASDANVLAPAVRTPAIAAVAADRALVTEAESKVLKPDVLRVVSDVFPVASNVPPTTALLVTPSEFSVLAPDVLSVVRDVFPVALRAPPTTASLVTPSEFNVLEPEVLSVDSDVPPVTVRPPPTSALLVIDAEARVLDPLTPSVPLRSVLPVTPSEANVVAAAEKAPEKAALAAESALAIVTAPVLAFITMRSVYAPDPTLPSRLATSKWPNDMF
jgi:hypothetical protein